MDTIWFVVLGLLLGGYFVGEGYAFGLGVMLPLTARSDRERRTVLAAIGPYFLGNEVWLVGAVGVLMAAFPRFEGDLFTHLYPLLVGVLGLIVLRDMALHLRSRRPGASWRKRWDLAFVVAGTGLAVAWGVVLGNLVQGVPAKIGDLFNPFALLCGLVFPALLALHASAFLALRTRGTALAETAVARGRQVMMLALPLTALTALAGIATPDVRTAAAHPAVEIALAVLVPLATGLGGLLLIRVRRFGVAFLLTSLAAVVPIVVGGIVLAGAMRAGAADSTTLSVLNWGALPIVPLIGVYQVRLWTAFRAPVDRPAYW